MNNSEITREHDARVHKIMGDKVRCLKDGTWQYEVIDGAFTTWYPVLPYTTLPNHAIDGTVLEWVQGQEKQDFIAWSNELMIILYERVGGDEEALKYSTLGLLARNYKPGDYARALLEVKDE